MAARDANGGEALLLDHVCTSHSFFEIRDGSVSALSRLPPLTTHAAASWVLN